MLKKTIALFVLALPSFVFAAGVDMGEFVKQAAANDKKFEILLSDEMKARYKAALAKPAGDLMVSVKGTHKFVLPGAKAGDYGYSFGLSKLFTFAGLKLSGYYTAAETAGAESSTAGITLSLPLVKNAFGFSDRMLEEIAGYEQEIAIMQAIEAYEDYMAIILKLYYTWYSDYASMETAVSALAESEKFYKNMQDRKRSGIAYDSDVNKAKLSYLEKKANYTELKQKYSVTYSLAKRAAGFTEAAPEKPAVYESARVKTAQEAFKDTRAMRVMELAVKKAGATEAKAFNHLLPSVSFDAGYTAAGSGRFLDSPAGGFSAGFSADMPLFVSEREYAAYETTKLDAKKEDIDREYGEEDFIMALENLRSAVEAQRDIAELAAQKEAAAEAVLKEERRNYTQARISLNDLINAVNSFEAAKFGRINAEANLSRSLIEWARLTDALVVGE